MKRGLVSACAALLVGSGWTWAQAPMPVTPNQTSTPAVRQVQAYGQDLQGNVIPGSIPATAVPGVAPAAPGGVPGPGPGVLPAAPGMELGGPLPASDGFAKVLPGERDYTCDQYQWYANADYLLWRINNTSVPVPATITPAGVVQVPVPGAIPPVTQVLSIGSQLQQGPTGPVNLGEHNGGRFTLGCWCDPERVLGFEVQGFFLEKLAFGFNTVFNNNNSNTNALIINTGLPLPVIVGGQVVANENLVFIGTSSGSLQGSLSQILAGGEANFRSTWMTFANTRIGFLTGFRTIYFNEDFSLRDTYTLTLPPAGGAMLFGGGTTLSANTIDGINCRNNFYGAQAGLDVESYWGQFFVQGRVKGALGAMRQTVDIKSDSFSPQLAAGGIIFGTGDVGKRTRTRISGVPEGNIRVGYQFCHYCRAYVGYDGIFMYNVVRPANQLAPGNNVQVSVAGTTAAANISQNTFRFNDSNLMIQGISFGVELRY